LDLLFLFLSSFPAMGPATLDSGATGRPAQAARRLTGGGCYHYYLELY
jgi:hypothetical protein